MRLSEVRAAIRRFRWAFVIVAATLGVALSDWPVGWSLWVNHPFLAALVAGFLLLLLAAAAVDAYLRARQARRWRSVGRAAAAEFSHIFDQTLLGLLGLLGFEMWQPRQEIEEALAAGRARAHELVGTGSALNATTLLLDQRDPDVPSDDDWQRERLGALIRDDEWVLSCHAVMVAASRLQLEVIGRWVSAFTILNDDRHVARIERTMGLLERVRAIDTKLFLLHDDPTTPGRQSALSDWTRLVADYRQEANYWYLRYQADATIPDTGPRMVEALRDRAITDDFG